MLLERLSGFNFLDLVILTLATYRLSIMLANDWEIGPWGSIASFRKRMGLMRTKAGDPVIAPGSFIDGLMCTHCNSVWLGVIFTIIYMTFILSGWPARALFLPLAISGGSVLIVHLAGKE